MISKFSVKKPYTVLVGVILAIVLGVVSFTKMTTDLLPNISLPYVIVMTTYPGASPETVEMVLRITGAERERVAFVGDRLYTDKAIADNAGVDFVCVLSGETGRGDLEKYCGSAPAIVVDTFDQVEHQS